ncbi:hypothetical protein BJ912DRAFT_114463 [Pholiota molesta]|nr:hypothetical protein BJ912DRAFT_114463 [Pholiota molesta]
MIRNPFLHRFGRPKLPTPPVPHLLKSNAPPSEAESLLVYKTIEEVERVISNLREILSVNIDDGGLTNNDRTELKIQLRKASEFVEQQKGITSILRGIPPEILQEIFSYTFPTAWLNPPRSIEIKGASYIEAHDKAVSSLWALAQVCQLWRTSALCMPSFRGYLPVIDIKTENKAETKRRLRILKEALHRSGNAPLNLLIRLPTGRGDIRDPTLDALIECSARWKQAAIVVDVNSLQFHFQSLKGRLPLLQSLTVMTPSSSSGHKSLLPLLQLPKSQLRYIDEDCEYIFRLIKYNTRPTEGPQTFELPQTLETLVIGMGRLPYALIKGNLPHLDKVYIKRPYHHPGEIQTPSEIFAWISTFTMKELHIDGRDVRHNEASPYSLAWMLRILPDRNTLLTNLSLRVFFPDNGFQFKLALLLDYTPALVRLDVSLPSEADIISLANVSPSGNVCVPRLEICNFYVQEEYTPHEKRTALNALGSSRCESRGPGMAPYHRSERPKYPRSARPIKTLAVYFAWAKKKSTDVFNMDGSLRRQELNLEDWRTTREFSQLEKFVQSLRNEIPELRGQQLSRSRLFNWGQWAEGIQEILRNIESLPVTHIQDVYLSEIHLVLKKISDGYVTRDDKYHFSDRARQILDKWRPLFEFNLKSRHWIARGNSSLMYLAADHPLRSSPEYFDSVVYGAKANIPTGPILETWSELLNL